jgi:LL-diaminopimelate aminotransferase
MTGDQDWLSARNEVYRQRRDLVIEALAYLGVKIPVPLASLYIWCPIPAGWSSVEFTGHILEKSSVSFAPGTIFGPNGEGYVRLSLTTPAERLNEAMRRLVDDRAAWMPKAPVGDALRGPSR